MAKKKTRIGQIEFNTQKAAIDHVRTILLSLESKGQVINVDEEWGFFQDLIKGHPEWYEKYGPGIKCFLIGRSELGDNIELSLDWLDGTNMHISWRTCVTGNATSPIKNLEAAMREAIDYQIEEFRNKEFEDAIKCGLCSKSLYDGDDIHVDHVKPFNDLFHFFITEYPSYPVEFDDCERTNRAKFKEADIAFKNLWKNFHEKHATLRLTHKQCNLSRKRK